MRYSKIPAGLFIRNRKKLLDRLEEGSVAVIQSNDQMVRNGDQYFPYRQSSDLFYLTGIEQEMTVLILKAGKKDTGEEARLFIRKPDPKLETWEGKKLDKKKAEGISGIREVYWLEEMDEVFNGLIRDAGKMLFNVRVLEKFRPEYPLRDERLMGNLPDGILAHIPVKDTGELPAFIDSLRMIKEPEELGLIRHAVSITLKGLLGALRKVRPGMLEYQVEAGLTHEFLLAGSGGHAYSPILASGAGACSLHYISNDRECKDGDLLLMDFGAEYGNYAADCTRTIPVNGKFSVRQLELYGACLRVFKEARRLYVPGSSINEINKQVGKFWEREHVNLGLYSARDLKRQSSDNPLVKKYYPHGTAHFMGLDVHDVGGKDEILKPGMVLTCEPGIYLPDEGTGIRLENDLLITEQGCEDLMQSFPLEPEEIEEIMNTR